MLEGGSGLGSPAGGVNGAYTGGEEARHGFTRTGGPTAGISSGGRSLWELTGVEGHTIGMKTRLCWGGGRSNMALGREGGVEEREERK